MTLSDFSLTPAGMILVLVVCALVSGFTICTVARWTVLPAVSRWLAQQQQQQQQQQQEELERQTRLRFYLSNTRRRARTAATTSEHARRVQANLDWLREMEDHGRRREDAIRAQGSAVAAAELEIYLRRDLAVKLGILKPDDDEVKNSLAFAEQFYSVQQYNPARDGLLYDSDDEDPEVIRGDKKGKKDR